MAKSKIRLVVTDFDGTYLDPQKSVTARALSSVRAMSDAGIEFTGCSGRAPFGMLSVVQSSGITLPFGALNGGVYMNPDKTIARVITLGERRARKAVRFFANKNIEVWLFTATGWVITNPNGFDVERTRLGLRMEPIVVDSFEPYLKDAVKVCGVSNDQSVLEGCTDELTLVAGKGACVTQSTPRLLDVTNYKANKGEFIRWLAKQLGIKKSEIASLGDMDSDIFMFQRSAIGIAMGNATEAVKSAATHITTPHSEEGFARAIEALILAA